MTTLSPSDIPLLPINVNTGDGLAPLYFFIKVLDTVQPGLGDDYLQTSYSDPAQIQAWFDTVLARDSTLMGQINTAAQYTGDAILAAEGQEAPLTIDLIADKIKDSTPKSVSGAVAPIVDTLADDLKEYMSDPSGLPGNPVPDGNPLTDGRLMAFIKSLFSKGVVKTDPIVLDLSATGTGVKLTPLASSSAYFDLFATGTRVHTGWVSPTTGILVNSTNPTSINNLFGSSSTDGFTALSSLDTNGDHQITAADPGYAGLYVWQDANGNGVADVGEVKSLSALGITSISLNSTEVNQTVNGNVIGSVATFTKSGTTRQVAEAFFDNSTMDTTYTGSYTLNPEALLLPDMRNYGFTAPLYVAMSQNSTLLGLVQNLTYDSLSDAATYAQQVENIMFQWAGTGSGGATSRGSYVNGNHLAALQQFMGESFTGNPNQYQGADLEQAWNNLFTAVSERLLVQGPLASLFPNLTYNYDTDSFVGTADLSAAATSLMSYVPTGKSAALAYLSYYTNILNALAADLGVSATAANGVLAGGFAAIGYAIPSTFTNILTESFDAPSEPLTGVNGKNNLLIGNDTNQTFTASSNGVDTMLAGNGSNIFYANSNTNSIFVGSGTGGSIVYMGSAVSKIVVGGGSNIFSLNAGMTVAAGSSITASAGTNAIILNGSDATNIANLALSGSFTLSGTSVILTPTQTGKLTAITGSNALIYGSAAGTYNLSAMTTSSPYTIYAQNTGGTTLKANNQSGAELVASASGTDTLVAGSGDQILYAAGTIGTKTLTGGSGNDIFYLGDGVSHVTAGNGSNIFSLDANLTALTGSSIAAGTGSNMLVAHGGDISAMSISGVHTLQSSADLGVTASQLSSFTTITGLVSYVTLNATTAGTYSLSGKTLTNTINLSSQLTTATTTLTGSQTGQTLTGGAGTTTFGGSAGAETWVGGSGTNYFTVSSPTSNLSGTMMTGGSGTNVLKTSNADLTVFTISNIHNLDASQSWVKMTNAEFTGFTTYTAEAANIDIFAITAGTYNLGSKTVNGTGSFNLDASQSAENITLIGTNSAGQALMGGSGTDVLTSGNGANDVMTAGTGATTMNAGTGNDVFNAGASGNDTMNGGQGTETYKFGSTFGQDTINNIATGTRTTAAGAIDFGFANSYHDLWFKQSGNNLVIDLLGTTDTITVNNWFGSNAGAKVSSIVDTTDNHTMAYGNVAALVSAMAAYTSSHTSFNPQATGTTMPTDTTLQNALTAAWGHS